MIRLILTAVAIAASGPALALLPPADEATKAKAAEAKARAGWQSKVAAYKACNVQNSIAAKFGKSGGAAAPMAAAAPAAPSATAAAPAGPTGGTPVSVAAALPLPPCLDVGPFAYNPPAQIPLETAGAHSPPGNATSPPSVLPNSAQMAPAKPATAQSKKP